MAVRARGVVSVEIVRGLIQCLVSTISVAIIVIRLVNGEVEMEMCVVITAILLLLISILRIVTVPEEWFIFVQGLIIVPVEIELVVVGVRPPTGVPASDPESLPPLLLLL